MHKTTELRIQKAAKFLQRPIALEVRDYLMLPLQTALDILEVMQDKQWHTTTEVADKLNVSASIVSATLRQLRQGGYPLESGNDGWRRLK